MYPNIILHPNSNVDQSEMSIAVNPANFQNFLVGSNAPIQPADLEGHHEMGYYYSRDQGKNWSGQDTLPSNLTFLSDPAVAFDLNDNAYYAFLKNDLSSPRIDTTWYVSVLKSNDGGATWISEYTFPKSKAGKSPDKPHITIDINPSSPFKNNIYVAWSDLWPRPIPIIFARSTDSGLTFDTVSNISGTSGYTVAQGVNLSVGVNGEIYAAWDVWDSNYVYATTIAFNKSTDGGRTWGTPVKIPIRGFMGVQYFIHSIAFEGWIRANSFPSMDVDRSNGPNRGTIYIVWTNGMLGISSNFPDIQMIKSTNGGMTWSDTIRVDKNTPFGTDQWHPWINVDPYGGVNIVFYDSRIDPDSNKYTQIYLGRSTDGGQNFSNYLISDAAFIPKAIPNTATGYAGDYIGITSTTEYVIPCWNDNRTGVHQAYIARFGIYPITTSANAMWNMASVPNVVHDFTKTIVWPTSTSEAWWLDPGVGYIAGNQLENRKGYWIRFPASPPTQTITYVGAPIDSLHIGVKTGWNMIGSLSTSLALDKVSVTNTQIVSHFWGLNTNGYYSVNLSTSPYNLLQSGLGYWVKVYGNGTLILDKNAAAGNVYNQCTEMPPAEINGVSLSSPANNATGVSITPTLQWSSYSGALKYHLQVSTQACLTALLVNDTTITTTSKQIGNLSYSTSYYWRVRAKTSEGYQGWSEVRKFTTEANPNPDPCGPNPSLATLDAFTVNDADGNLQQLYTNNKGKGLALGLTDFDLPPAPPQGIFNARFHSNKFIEEIPADRARKNIPIDVKDAMFPVSFSWDIKPDNYTRYWLVVRGGRVELTAAGSIRLDEIRNGQINLQAESRPCDWFKTAFNHQEEETNPTKPTTFSLSQNMPNPFNPSTIIQYALPVDCQVTLNVFNTLGQEVATLVDESQNAGYKSVVFDARNLPSGVYYSRLSAGSFTQVKKMLILR